MLGSGREMLSLAGIPSGGRIDRPNVRQNLGQIHWTMVLVGLSPEAQQSVFRTLVSPGTFGSAAAIPPIPKYDGRSPVTGAILDGRSNLAGGPNGH